MLHGRILAGSLLLLWSVAHLLLDAVAAEDRPSSVLFTESFDDAKLLERGWYDGTKFAIDTTKPFVGTGCIEYAWQTNGTTPSSSSGMRRLFTPSDTVSLKAHVRLSPGWGWTERGYHPHLMHFVTTENVPFVGPAATHLTVYIEPWNGRLRLAAQDIQN
ncbi:MAG TPA: hypothetical protein VM165_19490, partial [Planctomycetaceae bacterium]|nr:hypothetical protein [Planctomycetaceae bacterium]